MEFFKIRHDIPFMRHALVFNLVSFVTFLAAVFFLFSRGLHLSVEVTPNPLTWPLFAVPLRPWGSVMYRCKISAVRRMC